MIQPYIIMILVVFFLICIDIYKLNDPEYDFECDPYITPITLLIVLSIIVLSIITRFININKGD